MKLKLNVKSITGEQKQEIALPAQFKEPVRADLVKRAVIALQLNDKQPYGAYFEAGMRGPQKLSRRRRAFKTSYGHGISRVPRKIVSSSGTRFNWVGAFAPNTVSGRRAHPPKAEKIWSVKINKKENRKAIRSALAATINKELVKARGHVFSEYPLVVESGFESLKNTKEVMASLLKLGLESELDRVSDRKIRAGRGKTRGRKYKSKVGPLLVVSKDCELLHAARNIPGIDVEIVSNLNAELLAPGTDLGRLTVYTEEAIKRLDSEKLFTESKKAAPAAASKPKKEAKTVKADKAPAEKKVAKKTSKKEAEGKK